MKILLTGSEILGKNWEEAFALRGWRILRGANFGELLAILPLPERIAVVVDEMILPDARSLGTIRNKGGIPLFVAAHGGSCARAIELLDGGADDVVSPDIPGELLASKIEATARRGRKTEPRLVLTSSDGRIQVHRRNRKVFLKGQVVSLSKTQFDILLFILERPNIVIERKLLLGAIWKDPDSVYPATVDKHIEALRRKLKMPGEEN